jgi:hypothetical protein
MKKTIMILIAAMLVAMTLAACGSGGGSGGSNGGGSSASSGSSGPSGGQAGGSGSAGSEKAELNLPKTVTIATHATGGAYHSVGSGIAKLITEKSGMRGIVQPTAGPNAWMSDMEAGNIDFGLLQALDAGWAYTGGPGYENAAKNLRIVLAGNTSYNLGLVVKGDSGINTLEDLKGKRVGSDYGGNVSMSVLVEASLASAGLSYNDVNTVPVPEFNTGLSNLLNGVLDATNGASPDTPRTMEVDTAVNLKVLPFGNLTPEDIVKGVPENLMSLLQEYAPGVTLEVAPAGTGILDEPTVVYAYRIYLAASTHTNEDAVYMMLKTMYEHHKEIADVHPWLRGFQAATMLDLNAPVPYHDGAIRFFKEIGVWTDEHQKRQDSLLAQ